MNTQVKETKQNKGATQVSDVAVEPKKSNNFVFEVFSTVSKKGVNYLAFESKYKDEIGRKYIVNLIKDNKRVDTTMMINVRMLVTCQSYLKDSETNVLTLFDVTKIEVLK